ncbi:hypothetical protein [Streptomyces axinellae]|uniref:Uncharacterized protein n=1 Tax=Streptomyces axinellae TaxID=552788 RepID=A0ABP6DCF4_9ACTN
MRRFEHVATSGTHFRALRRIAGGQQRDACARLVDKLAKLYPGAPVRGAAVSATFTAAAHPGGSADRIHKPDARRRGGEVVLEVLEACSSGQKPRRTSAW